MHSCIYAGRVRHRRFEPVRHEFSYRLFLVYLDLDEAPQVFRDRWLWGYERRTLASFRREDYGGDPTLRLDEAVRTLVAERTGARPRGPIRLLTNLRYLGYCFNPLSVYYCFDERGERVETIVAEVTNTPWGERHSYVLRVAEGRAPNMRLPSLTFSKQLHVSPFLGMNITYVWQMTEPRERLAIQLNCRHEGKRVLDASLALARRPITGPTLAATLARHPWMTAKITAAIHWEALRLWLKGCPFVPHPSRSPLAEEAVRG